MADRNELLKEYRRLAKRADQRLVRLEGYAKQDFYKGATQYSYARAMKDISYYSGDTAKRFNTKPPENTNQLIAKIADMKHFLESSTSTKKGITNIYKKRVDTINSRYGSNFTWKDMANFYESESYVKLDGKYGSKTLTRTVSTINNTEDKVIETIYKGLVDQNTVTLDDDEIVDEIAKKLIKQGYNKKNLFGKK